VFSTLDCKSDYWQILLDEADRDKTTFCSHARNFRFLRMPFICETRRRPFRGPITLSYPDSSGAPVWCIQITSSSTPPPGRTITTMWMRCLLPLKGRPFTEAEKFHLLKDAVDYLGHVICTSRLEVAEKNTAALKEAKLQMTPTEIK
jgi:hypothetical protein